MDIKQLQYFMAAVECGSLNKAAERLYTSQPNVSRVIHSLEEELGNPIFLRSAKGIILSSFGEQLSYYAKNILKNVEHMQELSIDEKQKKLNIASYPSGMLSNNLAKFYNEHREENLHIDYKEGTTEQILDYISQGIVRIGVVEIAKQQLAPFRRILQNKGLEFTMLRSGRFCLYVGKQHPLYERKSVPFDALKDLEFVQENEDYFTSLSYMGKFSSGALEYKDLKHRVHTDSDHCMMHMLRETKLCCLGVDFFSKKMAREMEIHAVAIEGCGSGILLGYVHKQNQEMEEVEKLYLENLGSLFAGES